MTTRVELAHDIVLTFAEGLVPTVDTSHPDHALVSVEVPAGARYDVQLAAPLGLGVGLWHPDIRANRTLPPDWAGRQVTSLVRGAPVLALYDADAQALWGFGCSHLVGELEAKGGLSEEDKQILMHFTSLPLEQTTTILTTVITTPAPMAEVIGELSTWMAEVNSIDPLPLPEEASQPVYSTWYTYTQDVNQTNVLTEARLAAELGCKSVFIDDGWQVGGHGRGYGGTGDWIADTDKFDDLKATLGEVSSLGVDTVLWIAPLLLGHFSKAHEEFAQYAPDGMAHLNCQVLDPRYAQVRRFVVDTCRRIVADYGAAGLKIDFLNNAMTYQGTPTGGDIDDVGEAMRAMLAELREGLAEQGLPNAIIEFRQPYVSPAISAYGNCLRVGDCPADAWMNRAASIDLRQFVRGAVVHADPLMWAPEAGAPAVAQQFLSTFFSVPQVSMPLATLTAEQTASVAHHLNLWTAWRQVALHGQMVVAGAEMGYVQASATLDGRAVAAAYRPEVIDLDGLGADEVLVLNCTPADRALLRGTGWTVAEVTAPNGSAAEVTSLQAGLVEYPVPAFGSVRLTR